MNAADTTLLYVLRHAHSAPAVSGRTDYERALDRRGSREADAIRREMQASGDRPERIVCSGAARTRETLTAIALDRIPTEFSEDLYSGGTDSYLACARELEGARSGLIIGHNPMVGDFIALIAGEGEEKAMRRLADGVPTGGLAVIELRFPLPQLKAGAGFLRRLFVPGP